jgi:iron-sulfur cluster assembly accessory protein
MGIATFDPAAQPIVSLTPAAIAHLRRQVGGRHGLRIGVKRAGCSGYMYELDVVDAAAAADQALAFDGLTVLVDADAVPLLRGTEVDYVRNGLNASIRFRNPNAAAECGCGESFAVS